MANFCSDNCHFLFISSSLQLPLSAVNLTIQENYFKMIKNQTIKSEKLQYYFHVSTLWVKFLPDSFLPRLTLVSPPAFFTLAPRSAGMENPFAPASPAATLYAVLPFFHLHAFSLGRGPVVCSSIFGWQAFVTCQVLTYYLTF